MPDAPTFGLFLAAALAQLLVPGPAVLYIVARTIDQGHLAGLASVLGVHVGTLMHVAFAAIGLWAILASSATAFSAVKWLGAVSLVWLGLPRLLARDEEDAPVALGPKRLSHIFSEGVVLNALNPKTALFFLAFLPQFVNASRGAAWTQVMALGATFVVLGLCTDGLYALLSGTAGNWLRQRNESARFHRTQQYVSGSAYLALDVAIAAVLGSGKD